MDGDARWYLKSSKTADGQVRGNITDALFEIADALKAMTPPRTVEFATNWPKRQRNPERAETNLTP
ncbi:MAG: hypothetical protein ACYS7Y_36810 [Planctomycetota bacterium]|jgi:hypothetical protein